MSLALLGVRGFGRGICKGSVQLRVRSAQTYGSGPMRLKDVQRYLINLVAHISNSSCKRLRVSGNCSPTFYLRPTIAWATNSGWKLRIV